MKAGASDTGQLSVLQRQHNWIIFITDNVIVLLSRTLLNWQ